MSVAVQSDSLSRGLTAAIDFHDPANQNILLDPTATSAADSSPHNRGSGVASSSSSRRAAAANTASSSPHLPHQPLASSSTSASPSAPTSPQKSKARKSWFSREATAVEDPEAARTEPDLKTALKVGPQTSQNLAAEPRDKAPRRPIETTLKSLDEHTKGKAFKRHRREVAFAAPYPDSGVVVNEIPKGWREWLPAGPLGFNSWQGWYMLLFHTIGATVISGGINFGIACAMYRSQTDITYWILVRNTVAGDMGVTVLIQCIVTFLITSSMVHSDLTTGPVAPLRRPWPPLLHLPSTPSPAGLAFLGTRLPQSIAAGEKLSMGPCITPTTGALKRYLLFALRSAYTGSERNDVLAPGISWRQRLERIVWTALQGLLLGVIIFPWFWGIAMAITAPIYSARNLGGTWTPEVIKLIFGGLLATVSNPIIALMAMGAESSVKRAYPELEIWNEPEPVWHADETHA